MGSDDYPIDACECPAAGFCERHGIRKTEHLRNLCLRHGDYWEAWESGRGPGQDGINGSAVKTRERTAVQLAYLRELWRELHSYAFSIGKDWSPEAAQAWYHEWRKRVPSFGCGCNRHFAAIEQELPPVFETACKFFHWSVRAHNMVNQKLNKPIMEYQTALREYNSLSGK